MRSFLTFEELLTEAARRTKIWRVRSLDGTVLGHVSWFAHWRRYTFTPINGQVTFDAACLIEVGNFALDRTREHKA